MDYLGWELARQRSALEALLLGGGEARDREAARAGGRRSPAEQAGRYAGGGYGAEDGKAWEAARGTGQNRGAQHAGRIKTPVSAWEQILGAEGTGGGLERDGRGTAADTARAARGEDQDPPGGGTGARAAFLRPSGGYEARQAGRRAFAADTAETETDTAAEPAGERRAGERDAEGRLGGKRAGTAASGMGGDGGWVPVSGQSGAARRSGGSGTGPRGQDGLPVFQETGENGGTGPWNGPGETAALRAEDGARALSRAVQRDARRYDGGFAIY